MELSIVYSKRFIYPLEFVVTESVPYYLVLSLCDLDSHAGPRFSRRGERINELSQCLIDTVLTQEISSLQGRPDIWLFCATKDPSKADRKAGVIFLVSSVSRWF